MGKYDELIERLEKAKGPDRELDTAIFKLINPEYAGDEWQEYLGGIRHRNDGSDVRQRPAVLFDYYTASVDAALALVERMLPGWANKRESWSSTYVCELLECTDGWHSSGQLIVEARSKVSEPIAICIALLRTLQSQEASNGH